MSEAAATAQWGLIGSGNIGGEVVRQLGQEHVANRLSLNSTPAFVMRSAGIMNPDGETPSQYESLDEIDNLPDVVFVATPSTDSGKPTFEHIEGLLKRGSTVVTAEKGAPANFFQELRELSNNFKTLGINATVGGGTRIIDVAKEYCQDISNITQIHLALNGTLSTIMSTVGPAEGAGMSLGQAVDQAVTLGYAEPGAKRPYEVIKNEAEADIPKKTAILFNALGLSEEILNWHNLDFTVEDDHIAQIIEEARIRRFIVSLYPNNAPSGLPQQAESGIVSGFSVEHGGWRIVGGFRDISRNPLFSQFNNITGAGNGLVIGLGPNESDGVYSVAGPGAGISPTVNTMIDDYLNRRS